MTPLGDSYSTPPDSPHTPAPTKDPPHPNPGSPVAPVSVESHLLTSSGSAGQVSMTSYEKAIVLQPLGKVDNNSDLVKKEKEKGGKIGSGSCTIPPHVTSPVKQQPFFTGPPKNLLQEYPNVDIVRSSPATIKVGFHPSIETTHQVELPGTAASQRINEVITTPPHPTSPPSPSSSSSSPTKKPVTKTSSGCSSSVDAPSMREPRSASPGSKEYNRFFQESAKRKASATPSLFSTLSVSVCVCVCVCV